MNSSQHRDRPAPTGRRFERVLVVDDNPQIHEDFRFVLEPTAPQTSGDDEFLFGAPQTEPVSDGPKFQIDAAVQGQDALKLVTRNRAAGVRYPVAFIDLRMPPGWDGIQTANALWRVDPDIQVVLCTAETNLPWGELMPILANTERLLFARKPFDAVSVRMMALSLTRRWQMNNRLQERVERAEIETQLDALTGALNRGGLETRLKEAVQGQLPGENLSVLMIDLDHFKNINDTFGHQMGDDVLRAVVTTLKKTLRESDHLGRYGGEEFMAVLPGTNRLTAQAIAERCRLAIQRPPLSNLVPVTTSIGVAELRRGETTRTMVARADARLYIAKQRGRNRICYTESPQEQTPPI